MATAKKAPAKKAVPETQAAPAKKAAPAKTAAPAKAAAPAKKVAAKAPAKVATAAEKTVAPAENAPAAKRANSAFMKTLTPSSALAAVVGAAALPRTEVVKKLWDYIKANNLQDSVNRRAVNADAKLKEVFGKAQVTMFEIAGLIGKHLK